MGYEVVLGSLEEIGLSAMSGTALLFLLWLGKLIER